MAARGLDLPEVGLIIHYNLPQNIENYIHLCGRTARIYNKGTVISFIGPGDTKSLVSIEKLLGKKIEKFEIDQNKLLKSQNIVDLAFEIAENEAQNMGNSKEKSWKNRAFEAIGLENNEENKPQIHKKRINSLKNMLKKAKHDISLPIKRGSVITPELFEFAKKQKLI